MKKSQLLNGMVLQSRNCNNYIFMVDGVCKSELYSINGKHGHMPMYNYNEDLLYTRCGNEFDVVKVFKPVSPYYLLHLIGFGEFQEGEPYGFELIWESEK